MIDRARVRVELRLLGGLGAAWVLAVAQAMLWARLVLGPLELAALPWSMLAVPHAVALVVASLSLFADAPKARWTTDVSPSPAFWMLAGFITLPIVPLFIARDHRIRQAGPPPKAAAEQAFARLLRLPRALGLRLWTWLSAALVVNVLTLSQVLDLPPAVTLGLLLVWLCTLTPVALVATGVSRAFVRPQILSAPHRVANFASRPVLRGRMTMQSSVVSGALVLTPLCAAALVAIRTQPGPWPPSGALVFAGFIFTAAAFVASVLVARSVHHDVVRATSRIHAVVHDAPIPAIDEVSFTTHEARHLIAAVDRMVARISESNIAHYVAIEKAKEADRLKSQFLANMSHDLRSPLNAILGFSELLLSGIDGDLNASQRDMVRLILQSGRDLLREIDDILDTAKLEAGHLELTPQPTPVANLVTRAIASAKKRAPELPSFGVKFAPGLPAVVCDPQRSVQAIANVLLFAHEGIEAPKVNIEVKLGSTERGGAVFVDITVGHHPASPEDLARARSGFFRIPGHHGLGLGLPLAAAVLEQQGGALDIEALAEGMVFSIEVPAAVRRYGRAPQAWLERQRQTPASLLR
ncbi:MAG: HAMP domain-containing histidine kinase [Nannocystaceae bacterium]|nr:HAMP domain-containing histidine kinase [Nannocystaceae bacterium]